MGRSFSATCGIPTSSERASGRRPSDLDELAAYESDLIKDPQARAERLGHLRERGFAAERHPTAVDLMTDGVGRLWLVERHDWERLRSPTWLVFGPSGRIVGRWKEPLESLSLLDATEHTALVLVSDELGIQRVELREIQVEEPGGVSLDQRNLRVERPDEGGAPEPLARHVTSPGAEMLGRFRS